MRLLLCRYTSFLFLVLFVTFVDFLISNMWLCLRRSSSSHNVANLTDCIWFWKLNAQAGVMLAVFISPHRKLENYAYHELKIHYRLSYHNRSDCIGNAPTTVASSSRKSISSLLFLISMLVVSPRSLPICVNECVSVLLKQWFTTAQPLYDFFLTLIQP